MPRLMTHSRSFVADRGDPPPPSNKIPKSPFPPEKISMSFTSVWIMSRMARKEEPSSPVSDDNDDVGSTAMSSKRRPLSVARVPCRESSMLSGSHGAEGAGAEGGT
ncbi:uncharacterized protein [Aegilops tauschii subsp. strangulata]|uniref:uncharacterized protein n=1 Tax=Aegilops tauschii subsp. strangulata TaxID=200361 RepID=UPI003CC8B888